MKIQPAFYAAVLFNCTKQSQNITLRPGRYIVEAWGASGGNFGGPPGKGAYVKGLIQLDVSRRFYIFVGEEGNSVGVFNANREAPLYLGIYGGGSTDLRLENGEWDSFPSRKSRILVAAGGGGADTAPAGDGGALTGLLPGAYNENVRIPTGGTQTSGGAAGAFGNNYGIAGQFGIAGSPLCPNGYYDNGGGGGNGYYGGGGICGVSGGAGGSSFVSGYKDCNAIREDSTEYNIIPTGQPVHYSNFVFTDTEMIPGNEEMPAPNGSIEIGHMGPGFMRITNLASLPFSLRSFSPKANLALKGFLAGFGLLVLQMNEED